jgi:site-specific DNA recombinase
VKYLIYARVSPKGSGKRDLETSVARQIELCRQWIELHGGTETSVVVDEHVSGKDLRRPGLAAALADLRAGTAAWDAIIFYRLDRLSRSLKDFLELADLLRAHNRGFVSLHEQMDFATPTGRAMMYVFSVFSQLERELCSQRTRDRMVGIAEGGGWPVGRVPWGYRRRGKRDNRLEADPVTGPLVPQLFAAYLAGTPADQLRARYGLGRYSVESVCRILRNPVYLGKIVYGGREYADTHPALVAPDVFAAVQRRLPGRRTGPRPGAWKRENLLTGLLHCSCGLPMTTKYTRKGKAHPYYYYTCPDRAGCGAKPVRAEALEAAVLRAVARAPLDAAVLSRHIREAQAQQAAARARVAPRLAEIATAVAAAEATRAGLERSFAAGVIEADNAPHLNARLREARAELERLALERADLERLAAPPANVPATVPALRAVLRDLAGRLAAAGSAAERRDVIGATLERIERRADGRYHCVFRFARGGEVALKRAVGHAVGSWRNFAVVMEVAAG